MTVGVSMLAPAAVNAASHGPDVVVLFVSGFALWWTRVVRRWLASAARRRAAAAHASPDQAPAVAKSSD